MRYKRATTTFSFLDYVDLINRGGTEDWKSLYAEAKHSFELRRTIEEALKFSDPDIGEGAALWRILLDSMPQDHRDESAGGDQYGGGRPESSGAPQPGRATPLPPF